MIVKAYIPFPGVKPFAIMVGPAALGYQGGLGVASERKSPCCACA